MSRAAIVIIAALLSAGKALAVREIVQINADGTQTVPPNSIATPAQVSSAETEADAVRQSAESAAAAAAGNVARVRLYSTNYVVTSTVFVQSIGGTPYDPSNQTVRVYRLSVNPTTIEIIGTVKQLPLVPPALDWRSTLNVTSAWDKASATVESVAVPAGVTNAVAAYKFTLPRPGAGTTAFFRIVDNSTGASGSGLWWVVFGGIFVDGKKGYTGDITVTVAGQSVLLPYHGGILTEPEPLGGL